MAEAKASKKKLSLATQIFIALVLGIREDPEEFSLTEGIIYCLVAEDAAYLIQNTAAVSDFINAEIAKK